MQEQNFSKITSEPRADTFAGRRLGMKKEQQHAKATGGNEMARDELAAVYEHLRCLSSNCSFEEIIG